VKTRITELLGIRYPILQGAMAWISESGLTSAVSNAGGAGIIAAASREPDWLVEEIRKTKQLTDKPFGVNVPLLNTNKDELIEAVIREKVSFITLGAGNPVDYINPLKEAGIKVLTIVPNTRLAKRVEAAGADAIIIEGMEAGGHIGTQTTMALMTNVIPEISIPVIAAGGITDARGIAAAMIMGADGVQMGSIFILAEECVVHPRFKEKVIAARDTDSVVTGSLHGHGVRVIKNNFTDKYLALERQGAPPEVLNELATGKNALAALYGEVDNGSISCSQSVNPLKEIKPAREIINTLVAETIEVLKRAYTLQNVFGCE
jgi:enoyl-[acyl-carrier protein] reductase II